MLPWPGVLSRVIRPPWSWAIFFTMDKPNPAPPPSRRGRILPKIATGGEKTPAEKEKLGEAALFLLAAIGV